MAAHLYWRLNASLAGAANVTVGEIEMKTVAGGADVCTGGTAISSSDFSAGNNAAKAFDNILTTCWVANTTAPAWIGYQFASAVDIVEYTVLARSDNATNYIYTPVNWTFEWSDDGISWTVADTRVSGHAWFYLQKRIFTLGKKPRIIISETPVNVPSSFLGIHDGTRVNVAADTGFKYGHYRAHDAFLSWDKIETADNVFNWTDFDAMMAAQNARGVTVSWPVQGTPIHAVDRAWLESKTTVWQPNTPYAGTGIATRVRATNTSNNRMFILTQAGTSGATEPAWPTILSGGNCSARNMTSGVATVVDGTCIWQVVGDVYNNVMGGAPPDAAKVARLVTNVLNRYNLYAVEGSNEPNYSENYTFFYWGSAVNSVDTNYVIKQTRDSIRPSTQVWSPGFLNSGNFTNTTNAFMNALVTGGGGLRGSDIIDVACWHPYTNNKDDIYWNAKNGGFGILAYRIVAAAWTSPKPNIPIRNTEWGTSTSVDADLTQFNANSPKTRARQIERYLAMHACSGVNGVDVYAYGNSLCGDLINDKLGGRAAINKIQDTLAGKTITASYEYEDGSIQTFVAGKEYWFGKYDNDIYSVSGTTLDSYK